MTKKHLSITPEIKALEELFDKFNETLFESALSKPVITFNTDKTKGSYGWFTTSKPWTDEDGNEAHEINICCDQIASGKQVCTTLLHEMVHLYNHQNGVKDFSRGGTYHNSKFAQAAKCHGLIVETDEKSGYRTPFMTSEAEKVAFHYFACFDLTRKKDEKKSVVRRPSSTRKYECPCCGLSVRATKEVKVKCYDCDCLLEEV